MSPPDFNVCIVAWHDAEAPLRAIRTAVFVAEQGVPLELEWDGEDDAAIHALARDASGGAIGTARLLLHGRLAHIGRMAVVKPWRGKGVGTALLQAMLDEAARQGADDAFLNAQTYAVPFYEKLGFTREGDEFLDAGIPHYRMTRRI